MAFDPTSAQPAQQSQFDPTSAQSVSQPAFDPSSAAPAQSGGGGGLFGDKRAPYGVAGLVAGQDKQQPPQPQRRQLTPQEAALSPWEKFTHGIADPDHPNMWNVVYGLNGAYNESVTNGLMMQPVRQGMESLGIGMDRVKQLYPNATPDQQKQLLHQFYNQAVTGARQQAAQQTLDNPYPGHQVANFGANVLGSADPTWLFAPGASGAGKSAVARVVSQAGKQAALGSISNSAAQAMDIAEGQKKDFDIQQNLETAAFSGAFGAAHAGVNEAAPVVSPFVKQLFGNRGIDTTPPATPRMDTTPLTGNQPSMTPEDTATLKGLIRTGSVDDIKNFLNTKQGPKPSWTQVDQMVQARDAMPENYVGKQNFEDAINGVINDHQHQLVSDHVAAQTANWKNAPDINVVHDPSQIQDPTVRQQVMSSDPNGDALGVFGSDGKVHIFSSRINSPELANSVLYHEALGHYGLQQQFGAGLDSTLNTLVKRNVGSFGDQVSDRMKATGEAQPLAAEEVLAEMSQKGPLKPVLFDAVSAKLKQFGRRMGLDLSYSDNEIQHILSMAHDAVINGKGRDVIGNGFRGTQEPGSAPNSKWLNMSGEDPQNKFMFTGPKAKNFDPESATAFTASDGVGRNEISDKNAQLHPGMEEGNTYRLGDVLDHPMLYNEYPHLKDTPVHFRDMDAENLHGGYDETDGSIHLNSRSDPSIARSTVLHEVQHSIQDHEQYPGFAEAGAKEMTPSEYAEHPLEKEAYETEARKDMGTVGRTMEQPNKFMTRSQIAASPDYVSKDLDRIYKSLDENYTKETRPWAEDERDALSAGFSPSQIRKLKETNPGDLSVRLRRLQAAAHVADQKCTEIEQRLGTADQRPGDQGDYLAALADLNYLTARVKGTTSEIGRALNAAKAARSFTNGTMAEVAERLRNEGSGLAGLAEDPGKFMRFVQQIKQLRAQGNNAAAQVKMAGVNKPYWEQYLNSFHFNAMLSSLSTHVKAPLDMMTGISHSVMDHAIALPIGKLYNLAESMTGNKVKPGVDAEEVAGRLQGVLRSVFTHEVYTNTLHAVRTGEGSMVLPGGKSMSTSPQSSYGGAYNPRLPGILSKPTDLISAQDTFFRSHQVSSSLYGLGNRQARADLIAAGQKPTFDKVTALGSSYAHNPTEAMLTKATEETEKSLLLNRNKLTSWIDAARAYRPNMTFPERVTAFAAQNLAPFVRVASNSLLTRTIERSPLALMSPSTWKTIAGGGADAHLTVSRILYGTIKLGMLWAAADAGKNVLTGEGPDNPNRKQEMEAGGWRPNAVHEDGQFRTGGTLAMSLNPFDVHNSTAQMVKSMRDAYDKGANQGQVGNGLKLALGSILHDFASESWINDMAPAVDAATARGQTAGQKVAQFAGDEAKTWVPGILNQANRTMINPTQTDTRPDDPDNISGNVINSVKSAIPGLSNTLPTRYSVYGDPVPTGASLTGVHTAIPGVNGNSVAETQDPAEQELQRIGSLTKATLITPVKRVVQLEGQDKPRRLTTAEFEQYQHMVGREIVEHVRQEMNGPDWQNMSDDDKAQTVKDMESDIKSAVREYLFNNGQ